MLGALAEPPPLGVGRLGLDPAEPPFFNADKPLAVAAIDEAIPIPAVAVFIPTQG